MPVQLCSGSFTHVRVHVNLHICVTGRYICYMYEHLQVILQFLCPSQQEKNLPWQLLCPPWRRQSRWDPSTCCCRGRSQRRQEPCWSTKQAWEPSWPCPQTLKKESRGREAVKSFIGSQIQIQALPLRLYDLGSFPQSHCTCVSSFVKQDDTYLTSCWDKMRSCIWNA